MYLIILLDNYIPCNKIGGVVYWIQLVRPPCSVFRTFFRLNRQIMKWNLVWLFTIMSYRSSLSFVIIDQYLTELWANFHENFCYPDIFWINFSDIEMKLGIIVYNNELQIKFEFRCYWSIFDRVMALGLSHISEVKFAAGGILVPFRGRHLVLFITYLPPLSSGYHS
jgi:hypothetical protein